ncbi:Actin-interacting protein 1 [Hypsibius exemplaris]|uniref:Actin-interacting protein 1 n=1 Tax=Hypsibius exemplaris TaxID=2072580 RepID=A0A1W0XFJ2_HYPEX|nr:Actin-interacting protein 1 [Hypsibius exemplaris]
MSCKTRSIFAATPRTERGRPVVLGGDPKGKNFLYTNGQGVVIRDINNPSVCDVYTEHSTTVNVAKYSPSGFYIASADVSGKVRIWDTTQKEHILKNEFQPLGGAIKDLCWSPDSQRMAVCGDGRERYAHVFMADTGTSVGEIAGQSKAINSIDFRPARPFRVITGSEDYSVGHFQGPPFKFDKTLTEHTNFVNCVRYSPNGEKFASGGADGKIFIYDGKEATKLLELGGEMKAHNGGVYGICFSPDNTQLISASGDKTCKLWDVSTGQVVQEYGFGDDLESMQLGTLWQGEHILSISLGGFIYYLDKNNAAKPIRIIKGHNKSVTALVIDKLKKPVEMYTGSHDGSITYWNSETGDNDRISSGDNKIHTSQVQSLGLIDRPGAASGSLQLVSCGMDDVLKHADLEKRLFIGSDLKLPSMPKSLATKPPNDKMTSTFVAVACVKDLVMVKDGRIVSSINVSYEPTSIAIHPDGTQIAVGGNSDSKLHIYGLDDGKISSEKETLTHGGGVMAVAYSSKGEYLVAADAYRKVIVYNTVPKYEKKFQTEWGFHTARVDCVAWSPNNKFVVSGSLDTNIIVWYMDDPHKHVIVKGAHPMSQVNKVEWLDDKTIVSAGHDGHVKIWTFTP